MELTAVQIRTLSSLLDVGEGEAFRAGIELALRDRLESGIRPLLPLPQPLRLFKGRLSGLGHCAGLFDADLKGELPPFQHGEASAAGTLAHRAIEMDVTAPEDLPSRQLAERAAGRLERDRQFGPYWQGLDVVAQAELVMRAVRSIEQFRASFPPIRALRRRLAPVSELWLEAWFAGGAVQVTGKVDLLVNASRPGRSTRVLIDLKRGRARIEHAEDMRLYALLHTLRCGVPPRRVATFFLSSGEWQAEDASEEILEHAADRVVEAVRMAAALGRGQAPKLRGGPHCAWCPRRSACPAAWRDGMEVATHG
jgi:hypothetical protein